MFAVHFSNDVAISLNWPLFLFYFSSQFSSSFRLYTVQITRETKYAIVDFSRFLVLFAGKQKGEFQLIRIIIIYMMAKCVSTLSMFIFCQKVYCFSVSLDKYIILKVSTIFDYNRNSWMWVVKSKPFIDP